jgi:hypothetical protein
MRVRAEQSNARSEVERGVERAAAPSAMMKRNFHLSLWRRWDREDWELLGKSVAKVLEAEKTEKQDVNRFREADATLKSSIGALIKQAAPCSQRWSDYRRAARSVYSSAAFLGPALDEAEAAYWRHCALVWITLWHLSDLLQMTAEEAEDRLSVSMQMKASASVLPFPPQNRR